MADAGARLKKVMDELLPLVKSGITTNFIDKTAERLILKNGGKPSFKEVHGYKWTTCLPINEQIVHTPPSERIIKDGDLLTIDIGLFLKGFHTDFATSFIVGPHFAQGAPRGKEIQKFLKVGSDTIYKAIKQVKIGNRIGDISKTIQDNIESAGYNLSDSLVGHGIGKILHEDPMVPGILDMSIANTPKIEKGLVIAVEIIYMMGARKVELEKNSQWSIKTTDNSLSACFEHTVAVADNEAIILT